MRKDPRPKDPDDGAEPDPTTDEGPRRPAPEFRDDEFDDAPPSGTFRIPRV